MTSPYDPEHPEEMSGRLGLEVARYWKQYLEYWELQEDVEDPRHDEAARRLHRKLDAIGGAVRKLLHTLTPDADAVVAIRDFVDVSEAEDPLEAAAEVIRLVHETPIVRDSIRIALGFEAAEELLPRAEGRISDLLTLVAARSVSTRAASFLDRATRLYLWGFDPECVIMCRAVLEAALASRLADDLDADDAAPNLDNLLRIAGGRKILQGFERAKNRKGWRARKGSPLWRAERLKWAGNEVLHQRPEVAASRSTDIKDAREAVSELAWVLSELFPAASETPKPPRVLT